MGGKRRPPPRTTTHAPKPPAGKHPMTGAEARRVLADNVRRLRKKLGLTQVDAAELAGLCDRHWQKVEAGTINLTVQTMASVATALDVPLADLFAPIRAGRGAT